MSDWHGSVVEAVPLDVFRREPVRKLSRTEYGDLKDGDELIIIVATTPEQATAVEIDGELYIVSPTRAIHVRRDR